MKFRAGDAVVWHEDGEEYVVVGPHPFRPGAVVITERGAGEDATFAWLMQGELETVDERAKRKASPSLPIHRGWISGARVVALPSPLRPTRRAFAFEVTIDPALLTAWEPTLDEEVALVERSAFEQLLNGTDR